MTDHAIHIPADFDDLPARRLCRCLRCGVQYIDPAHIMWQHGSTWCMTCERLVENELWQEVEA